MRWLLFVLCGCLLSVQAAAEELVTLRGRVVTQDGGVASQAKIELVQRPEYPLGSRMTTCDEQGNFEIPDVDFASPFFLQLRATSADGKLMGVHLFDSEVKTNELKTNDVKASELPPVVLRLSPIRTVHLQVLDADEKPLPAAHTLVAIRDSVVYAANANESGEAVIQIPSQEKIQSVAAWKDGAGFDYHSYSVPKVYYDLRPYRTEFPADDHDTLKLTGARQLDVKVVDEQGQPIQQARVAAMALSKSGESEMFNNFLVFGSLNQLTNSEGIVRFGWIPKGKSITFSAAKRGEYLSGSTTPDSKDSELQIELQKPVSISGRVLGPDGQALEGVQVAACGHGKSGQFQRTTTTDAEGGFKLEVAPHKLFMLLVKDPKWGSAPYEGIFILPDRPVRGIELKAKPPTRVFGRLVDVLSRELLPDERVLIILNGQSIDKFPELKLDNPDPRRITRPSTSWSLQTDAQGYYEVMLGDGNYEFTVTENQHRKELRVAGETEINFELLASGARKFELKGTLIDAETKQPIENAVILGMPEDAVAPKWSALTKSDGSFSVKRHAESTHLMAADGDRTRAAVIRINSDQTEVSIEAKAVAKTRGRLVNANGQPLASVKLYCNMQLIDWFGRARTFSRFKQATTDADGNFEFSGLFADQPHVLELPGADNERSKELKQFRCKPGEDKDLKEIVVR